MECGCRCGKEKACSGGCRWGVLLFALLALFAFAGVMRTRDAGDEHRPAFARTSLTIRRADGAKIDFTVEIARTPDEQAYGLMFVKSLDDDAGMIFPYETPREVVFWMKNTLIPLDMLFVRPDGHIARIVAEAKPEDVTAIDSEEPVSAVVEIKGGEAKARGIAVGDSVVSAAFPAKAQ